MSEFAGTLSERVRIEAPIDLRTLTAVQEDGWKEVATCRASVVAEGAGPESEAMALSSAARFRVTIRSRDGVTLGQRVVWRGRMLLVKQRIDDPRTPDRILLRCEEMR